MTEQAHPPTLSQASSAFASPAHVCDLSDCVCSPWKRRHTRVWPDYSPASMHSSCAHAVKCRTLVVQGGWGALRRPGAVGGLGSPESYHGNPFRKVSSYSVQLTLQVTPFRARAKQTPSRSPLKTLPARQPSPSSLALLERHCALRPRSPSEVGTGGRLPSTTCARACKR